MLGAFVAHFIKEEKGQKCFMQLEIQSCFDQKTPDMSFYLFCLLTVECDYFCLRLQSKQKQAPL